MALTGLDLTLKFSFRLFAALLLGSFVGLERQYRQRMAGTRTNALVAAGASAFVMSAQLIADDPSASGRIASYVVAGVGFLGAGVIFKDGSNVRGLNTAATIWCSAAIGVLSGLGAPHLAVVLSLAILLTNTVLRPLAYRLHPVLPATDPVETIYEVSLTCRAEDETHLRALLLTTISQSSATLQSIHSEDLDTQGRMQIRATSSTPGRHNETAEQIVSRLSYEPGVSVINWTLAQSTIE